MAMPKPMMVYEIKETVRNQPTTFQLRRRKNIALGPVGFLIRDEIVIDDHVHEEACDENGRSERDHRPPKQGESKSFHRSGSQTVQDSRADDRGHMAVEDRGEGAREA